MAYSKKTYPQKDVYQDITNTIIEKMEKGELPWQKAWDGKAGAALAVRPQNAVTGEPYHKANAIYLSIMGEEIDGGKDPRFCTFAAAKANGWTVRKGAHGLAITRGFWADKDSNGFLLPKEKQHWTKTYSIVFHASQLSIVKENKLVPIPPYEPKAKGYTHEQTMQKAAEILKNSQANILNDQADQAFYRPDTDEIHLPPKEAFPKLEGYYSTALHELGHWTGHETRLKRSINNTCGSSEYAKEELRAEMASVYLSMETGLPFDPTNHAAYTQNWLSVLKKDKNEFFKAAKDAEAITNYVLDLVRSNEKVYVAENGKEIMLEYEKQTAPGIVEGIIPMPTDIAASKTDMHIKIYQAASECPWKFRSIQEIHDIPDFNEYYKLVFEGDIPKTSLDGLYSRFNAEDRPNGNTMHSMSMSDIVCMDGQHYYVDTIGFDKIDLHKENGTVLFSKRDGLTQAEETFLEKIKQRDIAIQNEKNHTTLPQKYCFMMKNEYSTQPVRIADQKIAKTLLLEGYSAAKVASAIQKNSPGIWTTPSFCGENKNYAKDLVCRVQKRADFKEIIKKKSIGR